MPVAPVQTNLPTAPAEGTTPEGEVDPSLIGDGTAQAHGVQGPTTLTAEGAPQKLTEATDGFEKSSGGNTPTFNEVPPNLGGADALRFKQGAEVASALGPEAQAALGELVQDFKDGKIPDAESLFRDMEAAFDKHGVAPPPPGFHVLEGGLGGEGGPQKQGVDDGSPTPTPTPTPPKPGLGGEGGPQKITGTPSAPVGGEGGPQKSTFGAEVGLSQLSYGGANQAKPTTWSVLGNMQGADIEALAFLVLMEASKSAQQDLKAIMAGVKSINNAKAKQRELLGEMQKMSSKASTKSGSQKIGGTTVNGTNFPSPLTFNKAVVDSGNPDNAQGYNEVAGYSLTGDYTKQELDTAVDKAKGDLDSMSEMGEMESLRLQMAMDRMSKMMSTLSNLLKKISDTSSGIVQNLK